jgi:hypothetical protein
LAQSLLPIFESVVSVLSDLAQSFSAWVDEHPQLAA